MRNLSAALVLIICVPLCGCAEKNIKEYSETVFAMDTVMDLKVYAQNDQVLSDAETEIRRIEKLLDRGNYRSDIYKINKYKSAEISDETAYVINCALEISERTGGAFDITISPVMDLWGFYNSEFNVPQSEQIKQALECVGYDKVDLDGNSISIPDGTAIDLGGAGKGYTSDRIAELLKSENVNSGIISLGGNVQAIGRKPDGSLWTVGIADPLDKSGYIGTLKVIDKAVITSGSYQRYFEYDGKIYHHIIDPETGVSAESGLLSVTVISESGIKADCLSTALFVLGLDKSIELWKNSSDFEAVFVDDDGVIYVTKGINSSFESDNDYIVIE